MRDPRGQRSSADRRTILLLLLGVAAVLVVVFGAFTLLNNKPQAAPIGVAGASPSTSTAGSGASPGAAAGASAGAGATATCPSAGPAPLKATDTATVTLTTSKGDIVIAIKGSLAPHATANFVALAECGFYDGVVFHRLVPGFVIQGGDGEFGRVPGVNKERVGTGGPGYTITDDPVTTEYKRGVIAMARTSAPNSQGSQFFVVLSDEAAQALAAYNTYAIIGEVTSGMDAVDAIGAMPNAGGQSNAALDPLPITKATVTRP